MTILAANLVQQAVDVIHKWKTESRKAEEVDDHNLLLVEGVETELLQCLEAFLPLTPLHSDTITQLVARPSRSFFKFYH